MKKNLKKELAIKLFTDPDSPSFLNKSKSLRGAGYSEMYAHGRGMKMFDNINLADKDYGKLQPLIDDLPNLVSVFSKKTQQMLKDKVISAKDYSAALRQLEIVAKLLGILTTRVEKRETIVKVTIPITKCPACGVEMDIMSRDYEKESPVINAESSDSEF